MKILFVHQNFPAQFWHLSAHLAKAHTVFALGQHERPVPPGVRLRRYQLLRPAAAATHPLLQEQEGHVLRAEAAAAAAFQLQRDGFVPDLIVAHPGWGEALFLKEVFPRARLLIYCEFYYALHGQDVGFDPEVPPLDFAQRCRLRLRNTSNLLSLQIADAAMAPTRWQRSTYPAWAQPAIEVIHDGIDTSCLQFNPAARLQLPHGPCLRPGDEVLSYVARHLEPVRGFQVFMRTLPALLRRRPRAHVLVVGGDEAGYGHAAPGNRSWRDCLLQELDGQLDLARIHFLGKLPYRRYLDLLSVSRVHCYWTAPFVLSWSFLEAAQSGLPVVASATAPVEEFAGQLGVATCGFFDAAGFAAALEQRLARPRRRRAPLALAATRLDHCLQAQQRLLFAL